MAKHLSPQCMRRWLIKLWYYTKETRLVGLGLFVNDHQLY